MVVSTPVAGNSDVNPNFQAGPMPKENKMPYVNIKITREGTTKGETSTTVKEKQALIKGVSDLLFEVLGKPHNSTFVVIDEVETDNWGVGGIPVTEHRKQAAAKAG
tara:strand:- start:439 stop:756 length:318 start_codon:yes stop_codon:yes gene_type:complete